MFNVRSMAAFALLLAGTIGSAGCHGICQRHYQCQRDGVFVHIGKGAENPHAVAMGLKMATLMAEDHDVLVYFDQKGVYVVLADAESIAHTAFESSHAQLADLIERGVPLYVCPSCLKAAGKTPEDVMDGVQIANKEGFFNFTKGRIITFDY